MTDRDLLVYIRNAALALGKLAEQNGVTIYLSAQQDGYVGARAGEYEYIKVDAEDDGGYEYRPLNSPKRWRDVTPDQIVSLQDKPKGSENQ